jgi:hypothetical protein
MQEVKTGCGLEGIYRVQLVVSKARRTPHVTVLQSLQSFHEG